MKVRMIRDNGMEKAKAGEVLNTSPAHAAFLIRYGWADPVSEMERIEKPESPAEIMKEEKARTAKKPAATKAKPKTATAAKGKAKK